MSFIYKTEMVDRGRIELPTEACKATVFPIIPTAQILVLSLLDLYAKILSVNLVEKIGFEPMRD